MKSDLTRSAEMRSDQARPQWGQKREIMWDQLRSDQMRSDEITQMFGGCLNEMLILNLSTWLVSEDLSHEFQSPVLRTIPVFPLIAMYQNGLRTYEPRLWIATKRAGQYFAYRSVSFFEHPITSSPIAKYAWWNYKNSTRQMTFAAAPLNHPWTMGFCMRNFEIW